MGNTLTKSKTEKYSTHPLHPSNLQPLNVHHGQEMPVTMHATSRKHLPKDGFTPNPETRVGMASNPVTQGMHENTLPNTYFHPKSLLS